VAIPLATDYCKPVESYFARPGGDKVLHLKYGPLDFVDRRVAAGMAELMLKLTGGAPVNLPGEQVRAYFVLLSGTCEPSSQNATS
jgi:hypothetical protein